MRKVSVAFTLVVLFFHGGCGIVGRMGTAREHEKKIAAEYDLGDHKGQKILVLVDQPAYLNAGVNLRFYLTEAISESLVKKVKLVDEQLVGYSELSEFRSNKSGFSLLSPVEVSRALDADIVLLVMINDCEFSRIGETDYYKGFLDCQSVLFDTATGRKLWPESARSKSIKVGFEVERHGQEAATGRLAAAVAHCLVRCFYDCRKDKFKIAEDRSGVGWKDWKK